MKISGMAAPRAALVLGASYRAGWWRWLLRVEAEIAPFGGEWSGIAILARAFSCALATGPATQRRTHLRAEILVMGAAGPSWRLFAGPRIVRSYSLHNPGYCTSIMIYGIVVLRADGEPVRCDIKIPLDCRPDTR